ncbi:MAG: bifunctional phosphoribosylaminoimidazolecarboxamide formyltransferase/IMP cyclohydrolase [Bacteroidetes bacterium CG02_land_8_20_14_3_00_31_25]|nr:bifunctional phosphoribosylaminoimidazolecarboxamide formyltransferase/IMP cyclohydrolase [Bacteroidota bacterium]PIV62332.1 MAG: bifunctional phosphoribosylaminoimidazolecarboxamide formyltransferase/IMP cyclohydrolase [Bacteroidetes bacterium CG02_land_8_20_14_3_00_31_25]PIY06633.1 MAG: bifunctional phosphoribosylaminoimidazolecarboxamide formyltransferase/IMP cyclohydrolase [Bacteroidetes bacterium CG_4_10_14_3_um_filter_31_20]
MNNLKEIKTAFISVYYKDGLAQIVTKLHELNISIISTGGTKDYIEKLNIPVTSAEDITGFPSILGGRVKTLHPNIFGGILARRNEATDIQQVEEYKFSLIDLVIVDLYPFEETVAKNLPDEDIIEKIDIGGISLIRAAAKNFNDVAIISCKEQYSFLYDILEKAHGKISFADRKQLATEAFEVTSHYDTAIYKYFAKENNDSFKISIKGSNSLRYGENPHQNGKFYGNLNEVFEQLHGKEISYNNLLDIDAAISLINEFKVITVAIIKHNNACGLASVNVNEMTGQARHDEDTPPSKRHVDSATRSTLIQTWKDALAGDPVSAFGGIVATNTNVDKETALEVNKIFFEVIIAPSYSNEALEILKQKKNRIILISKNILFNKKNFRTLLNGVIEQDKDLITETISDLKVVTETKPTSNEIEDLLFANILVKHTKSNAIVLAKNKQLLASGAGQTSRVDALKHAIEKAKYFGFDLNGAVMSSDAFFPFADSVEIAYNAEIKSVIQPGGSIRDNETINFCNEHKISMVFTGIRHFKH